MLIVAIGVVLFVQALFVFSYIGALAVFLLPPRRAPTGTEAEAEASVAATAVVS